MPRYHFDGFDHNADDGDKSNDALMQKEVSSRAGEESSIEMCGETGFEVRRAASCSHLNKSLTYF